MRIENEHIINEEENEATANDAINEHSNEKGKINEKTMSSKYQ